MSPLAHGHKGGLVLFEVTRSKIVPFAGRYNELEMVSETNYTREDNCTPPPPIHMWKLGGRYKSKAVKVGEGGGA